MCWCPIPFRRLKYYDQDLCCPDRKSLNSSLLCQVLSLSVDNQDRAATSIVAGRFSFSCVLLFLYSFHGHMISSTPNMHLSWNFQYGSWMLLSFSFLPLLWCSQPSRISIWPCLNENSLIYLFLPLHCLKIHDVVKPFESWHIPYCKSSVRYPSCVLLTKA